MSAPIDPTNVGMLILVAVSNGVSWLLIMRRSNTTALQKAAQEAASKATDAAGVKDLAEANQRIATALEAIQRWQREHEREDDQRWSRTDEILKQQANTAEAMSRMLEGLQRQITNVALGLAPADAASIPPTRRNRG